MWIDQYFYSQTDQPTPITHTHIYKKLRRKLKIISQNDTILIHHEIFHQQCKIESEIYV